MRVEDHGKDCICFGCLITAGRQAPKSEGPSLEREALELVEDIAGEAHDPTGHSKTATCRNCEARSLLRKHGRLP